jgi:hypothetical protein
MASLLTAQRGVRNQSRGYFIPLGNVANKVLGYTPGTGAGGSYVNGSFAVAAWAAGGTAASPYTSTISTIGAGGVLRDHGKTILSAGRVFRKVQLLVPTVSTFGVAGPAPGAAANVDYLTGYIELHSATQTDDYPGSTIPAQVAYYPTLF